MTLRVGVNLLWLRSGQVGGSQEYLLRQLTGLHEINNNEFDVTLFVQPGFAKNHMQLGQAFKFVEAPSHRGIRVLRILLEQTWLAVKARKFDLMHHGGGTMPLFAGRRTVLTIHDVQYLFLWSLSFHLKAMPLASIAWSTHTVYLSLQSSLLCVQ